MRLLEAPTTILRRRGSGPFESWSDVDSGGRADKYFSYLDTTDASEMIQATRLRSFELLGAAPGSEMVEVGAGTGTAAFALAARVAPGGRVVGVDRSTMMVEEARRRAEGRQPACEFVPADALSLPFADESFDGYRAERVYEHIEDPAAALAEARRILRPGGRIVIAEPDWEAMLFDTTDRKLTREIMAAVAECQTQPWIGRQLRRLLLDAGFAEVETEMRTTVTTTLDPNGNGMGLIAGLAASSVSRKRLDAWLAELEERGRAGTFFSSATFFVASATRPPIAAAGLSVR